MTVIETSFRGIKLLEWLDPDPDLKKLVFLVFPSRVLFRAFLAVRVLREDPSVSFELFFVGTGYSAMVLILAAVDVISYIFVVGSDWTFHCS